MEQRRINDVGVSPRALGAAALAGGWSMAAEAARYGWQGAALGIPAVLLAGVFACGVQKRVTARGAAVRRVCCALWGPLLLGRTLARCVHRLALTGGGGAEAEPWLLLLLLLPLLWMTRGSAAPFFRMVVLCAPAVGVTVGTVLLWGAARSRGEYLLLPAASLSGGFWAAAEAGSLFLFLLPYINKEGADGAGALRRPALLAAGTAALAGVTAGVLSPAVASRVEAPLFTMAAALGRSFRAEGLLSCLWVLPDLIACALLVGVGRRKPAHGFGTILAGGIFAAMFLFWTPPPVFWGVGTLIFAAGMLLVPGAEGIISGWYRKGKTTSCGAQKRAKKVRKN